jgi:alpha-glucosidase
MSPLGPQLSFIFKRDPFSFQVVRKSTGEALFDTTGTSLVFERQFLRLKTWLPDDPNLYGLGEHTDSFRLHNTDYRRTFWARDAGAVPHWTNLYGSHPVYLEHRLSGTHGVFLANSNGMDVILDRDRRGNHFLEYRPIGGILDFYFMSGPSPVEVSRQYAEIVGTPAMVPYWSLGFHQCKYGYRDWFEVAEVVHNYSLAGIPLEYVDDAPRQISGFCYPSSLAWCTGRYGQTLTTWTADASSPWTRTGSP